MDRRLYGSVSNQAVLINELYGGSNSGAQRITKLYGPVLGDSYTIDTFASPITNFDIGLFRTKLEEFKQLYPTTKDPAELRISGGSSWYIFSQPTSGPGTGIIGPNNWSGIVSDAAQWGITLDSTEPLDTSYRTIATFKNIQVEKSKLIHQGFGHIDYGYGYVVYYTDSNHTSTTSGILRSQVEVETLVRGASTTPAENWNATIDGITVPNSNLKEITLSSKVSTLGSSHAFLSNCRYVTKVDLSKSNITDTKNYFCWRNYRLDELKLPTTLTTIGDRFGISIGSGVASPSPSKQIIIPNSVLTIGGYFLNGAENINQNISLPDNITSIGESFMGSMKRMVGIIDVGSLSASVIASSNYTLSTNGTATPSYSTGITIAGANRAEWLAKFPNRDNDAPYRKLLDAGY